MDVEAARVACAGAVVQGLGGRILVVERAHPPSQGAWSIPGGRVEAGETAAEAARREVREETGLVVEIGPVAGRTDVQSESAVIYDVVDFWATPTEEGATLRAGDDAVAVRWVTREELTALPCTPGLVGILDRWRVWSARVG